jgi:hypothetical protein
MTRVTETRERCRSEDPRQDLRGSRIDLHVETEVGEQIENGILNEESTGSQGAGIPNIGQGLRTTGVTEYELDDGARSGTGNADSSIDEVVDEDDKGDDEQAGILTEPTRGLESTSR